jgi:enamine deaminase RidA (YjgF/YER057c/UK114 family)
VAPTDRTLGAMEAKGLQLPALRPPAGSYVPYVETAGPLLYLSGQGADGRHGRLGEDMSIEEGQAAARECMLNLLAQARDALGSLDRVKRVVKIAGFIACTESFNDTPEVLNGASELLEEALGDRGRHARSAIGVQVLPRGFAVEVEAVFEIQPSADSSG